MGLLTDRSALVVQRVSEDAADDTQGGIVNGEWSLVKGRQEAQTRLSVAGFGCCDHLGLLRVRDLDLVEIL